MIQSSRYILIFPCSSGRRNRRLPVAHESMNLRTQNSTISRIPSWSKRALGRSSKKWSKGRDYVCCKTHNLLDGTESGGKFIQGREPRDYVIVICGGLGALNRTRLNSNWTCKCWMRSIWHFAHCASTCICSSGRSKGFMVRRGCFSGPLLQCVPNVRFYHLGNVCLSQPGPAFRSHMSPKISLDQVLQL